MSVLFKHKRKIFFCFLLFNFFAEIGLAQHSSTFLRVDSLTRFIASDYFNSLKIFSSDIDLVDTIYQRSLGINNNNLSEALLIAVFATIPYKVIPINLPIVKLRFDIPLVSSDSATYITKNKNLPKKLLHDSPDGEHGDKDKLAHFFGNAFLEYNSHVMDFTEGIGYFVEVFEEEFIGETKIDFRDMRANKLGELFGKKLKTDCSFLPSYFFINEKRILEDEKNINH